jgi:hypothetical protein
MELPARPVVTDSSEGNDESDGNPSAPAADGAIAVMVTRTNPMYGHDAPLIRLTVVLDLEGMTWVPRARDEGIRD